MKKKLTEIALLGVLAFALAMGGSRADAANINLFDTLTAKQKEIMVDQHHYTEEEINAMDYEQLNWFFLGTGHELYNQSSGVEAYGVSYTLGKEVDPAQYGTYYYNQKSTSDRKITYEEALAIRQKEQDIRIEDYMDYAYVIKKYKEMDERILYKLYAPIANECYPDTYVSLIFLEYKDGRIETVGAPFLYYCTDIRLDRINSNSGVGFSFYYNKAEFDDFYRDPEHMGADEPRVVYGIRYSSVTDRSLVLDIYNHSDVEYHQKERYAIYQMDGTSETLLKTYQGEPIVVGPHLISPKSISLDFDGSTLAPGTYRIEYGEDKAGEIYTMQEFTVE